VSSLNSWELFKSQVLNPVKRVFNPIKRKTILVGDDPTSTIVVNASATIAAYGAPKFSEKLDATRLINVPETLATLRASHRIFAKTQQEDLRQAELSEMHRHVHSLAGFAGLVGFRRIVQMSNALETLLIEIHAKPRKITPSVTRTVAQAVDTLAYLFNKPQAEVLGRPKILVIDDEVVSRHAICAALGKSNLPAVSLDDSVAAQHLLERDHFDLIFLDVEMPGQSGLDLCVKIRQMATNRATPVVFVTAHSDFGSRAQSTLSGGNDFIAKPFLLVELAVKALTCLLKESPQAVSAVTAQTSAPVVQLSENIRCERTRPPHQGRRGDKP
jgi:CheY-like chemotaxis protein